MFSFRVLTCLRIISIPIMLILNKFRHVWESYESYQFISYWIWTSLDMFQHVQTCLRIVCIVTIHIILNLNKFRQVWTCSDVFENHMNLNNSYHIEFEQVKTCLFQQVQTCLRIIWIITIHIILNLNKFRHVSTCSDMFWESHELYQFISYWIWTSVDMFQHVQTCLRIVWIITIYIQSEQV